MERLVTFGRVLRRAVLPADRFPNSVPQLHVSEPDVRRSAVSWSQLETRDVLQQRLLYKARYVMSLPAVFNSAPFCTALGRQLGPADTLFC